jgi:tRNA (adenine37-N6)-methyltransferase
MFTFRPIGVVRTSYTHTDEIPKGCGAQHDATGTLEIAPEFAEGLTDIEGFSHLFVLWAFDQAEGFDLLATPPNDTQPHGGSRRAPRAGRIRLR